MSMRCGITAICVAGLGASSLLAQTITNNTLHGFCGTSASTSTCTSNGVITPTSSLAGGFGFIRSPNSNNNLSGPNIWLTFLIPNTVGPLSFSVTQTTATVSTQSMSLAGTWSSGSLASFLGLTQTGGPNNPINALLPQTQTLVPGATGYEVYQANFGAVNFATADPTYTTSLSVPLGTVVLAYIKDTTGGNAGTMSDSTANSSALLVSGPGGPPPPPPVPEPVSALMLGTVVALTGIIFRKKRLPRS